MSAILTPPNPINQNPAFPPEPEKKQPAEKAGHLLFLDGLRALAALFVVMHHSWLQIWPLMYHKAPVGLMAKASGWLLYGHYAVALFIVLSGFSLMLSVVRNGGLLRGGAKTFFARRARRILPPYYFALLFSAVLGLTLIRQKTGTHWDISLPVYPKAFLIRVLLLQDFYIDSYTINHAFWSIAVEWQYYFFFPVLVWGWRKMGGSAVMLAAFALSFAALKTIHYDRIHPALFPFFALFVFGMLGAALCFDERTSWRKWRDSVPWLAIAFVLFPLTFRLLMTRFAYAADYPFGLACLALLVAVGRSPEGKIRAALSWKPLAFIGGFSYSIYLIHAPLIQLFWQYVLRPLHLSDNATFLLLELVGTPLFVAIAYGFYWFCERPFLTPALKRSALTGP